MAFPTIPTVAGGRVLSVLATAPSGTHTSPNLSSLTKNSGDLLIAIVIIYDGNSTNAEFSAWGGSFTEFVDQATTATMGIGCAYKWSTGSESGTFTVTTADASTNDSAFFLLSIPGAHAVTPPEGGTIVNGTTAAADPASFNPAGWDAEDTLWIAVGGSGETSTTGSFTGVASAPANYSDYAQSGISADVVGGVEGAVAFRQLNAASTDVGVFSVDLSNARNSALVLAVRPRNDISVTPGIATLSLTGFTPTVTAVNPILVTPGLATLTTARFTPTVVINKIAVPGTASLTTTRFAPTVTTPRLVTPGLATLTTTRFAPTVLTPRLVTPGLATLTTSRFAATVSTPRLVTPGAASLTLTAFTPSVEVTAGGGASVTPGTASLSLTAFTPSVSTSANRLVTPGLATLALNPFAATVTASAHQRVTPGTGTLTLTLYPPTVVASDFKLVTPGPAALTLTSFEAMVTVASASPGRNASPNRSPGLDAAGQQPLIHTETTRWPTQSVSWSSTPMNC